MLDSSGKEAYFRDIAGSVPGHCNKVNIAIVMNYFGFTEHREVKFTLYRSLLSVIALCLKNVHTLI